MDKNMLRLNAECRSCAYFSKGNCKGKERRTPCIVYKSQEEYAQESIKAIRKILGK